MFNRNANYEEWLLPYLEDGLDEARAAELAARLAADPALAQEAAQLKEMQGHLREAAARQPGLDTARVPADLWPRLHARLKPAPAPRRTATLGWATAAGVAALAWAALWLPTLHAPPAARKAAAPPVKVAEAPRPNTGLRPPPAVSLTLPARKIATPAPKAAPPAAPKMAAQPGPDPFGLPAAPAGQRMAGRAVTPGAPPAFPLSGALSPAPASKPAGKNSTTGKPTWMASNMASLRDRDRASDGNMNGLGRSPLRAVTAPLTGAAAPASVQVQAAPLLPPAPAAPAPASAAEPMAAMTDGAASSAVPRDKQGAYAMSAPTAAGATGDMPAAPAHGMTAVGPDQTAKKAAPESLGGATGGGAAGGADASLARRGVASGGGFGGGGFGGRAFVRTFDAGNAPALEAWQATLAQALSPPLLGDDLGVQQANGALTAARQSGQWEALRARLEQKRSQASADIVTARMLAALYDFAAPHDPAQRDLALRERRRLTALAGVVGEDWFALALAEEQAGNKQAARTAYRRALDAPAPLSAPHAAQARQRG